MIAAESSNDEIVSTDVPFAPTSAVQRNSEFRDGALSVGGDVDAQSVIDSVGSGEQVAIERPHRSPVGDNSPQMLSLDWPRALAWRLRQQLLDPVGTETVSG